MSFETPPHFIVGMARAGTQWMCKCLNEHPEIATFGESMFWGRNYIAATSDGTYSAEQMEKVRANLLSYGTCIISVDGTEPGCLKKVSAENIESVIDNAITNAGINPTPERVFQCLAEEIANTEGKRVVVEKTPHHLNWIDRITQALPESKYIVMVREPYGFMLSYKHQGERQIERIRKNFRKRYHPLACALVWKASINTAKRVSTEHPNKTLLVEFSNLVKGKEATFNKVQVFLGVSKVDLSDAVPPDNTSFPGEIKPKLRSEDYFWLNLVAGKAIRAGGYSIEHGPFEIHRILCSVIRLPFWMLRNFFNLRNRISGSTTGYLLRWVLPAKASKS